MTGNLRGIDPVTGELLAKVCIDVHLSDEPLPRVFLATDWVGASILLAGTDFAAMASRVEFVSITNRSPA